MVEGLESFLLKKKYGFFDPQKKFNKYRYLTLMGRVGVDYA